MPTWELFRRDETYWGLCLSRFIPASDFCFPNCVFHCVFFPQRVGSVRQAPSPLWVTSINGGMFFLPTWRRRASMWATPSVTVWMVGVFFFFLYIHILLSVFTLVFLSLLLLVKECVSIVKNMLRQKSQTQRLLVYHHKWQILSFKKLKPGNVWHFSL